MRLLKFTFFLLSAILVSHASLAEDFTVVNADGVSLSVIADFPSGEEKYPAIVLAPGQGYHMASPAMEETARALTVQGIAVFRFNWAYFTTEPKGQPSSDLSKELQDLQTVVAAARKHRKVATQNVSVGGKSLGSLVAWRALSADAQLRSALLLTPVCSRIPKGETLPRSEAKENYPGFENERRPTLSISGVKDPLCAPAILYGLAGTSTGAARVAIVGGDHSYENQALLPVAAEAARKLNLAAVSVLAASFVAEVSSTPK